jgi:putative ABC transport system permease protein
MTLLRRLGAIVREALASAWAQPVASLVTVVMVAGMCATVLLTTGRTVGAEEAVVSSIDAAGTRSIVVRAEQGAGLTPDVLERLAAVEGVEWLGAFGPATDITNSAIAGGTPVPARAAWITDPSRVNLPDRGESNPVSAWASELALMQLGMLESAGGAVSASGADYSVSGPILVPDYLMFLEPLVLIPSDPKTTTSAEVSILVVIAAEPELVAPLKQIVQSVLALDDPAKATVSTSEDLATLRALVEGQLGDFSRSLVIVIFSLTAFLVASILYGLVMLRRKDFGRRRALGASQPLIIGLLLTQIAALAFAGSLLGSTAAAVGLAIGRDPLPGLPFFVAIGVLAVGVSVIAGLIPALIAARRDPLRELRVP